jgi:hypothetical protein
MRKIEEQVLYTLVPLILPILTLSKDDIWFVFDRKKLRIRSAMFSTYRVHLNDKKKLWVSAVWRMATSGTQIICGCYFWGKSIESYGLHFFDYY